MVRLHFLRELLGEHIIGQKGRIPVNFQELKTLASAIPHEILGRIQRRRRFRPGLEISAETSAQLAEPNFQKIETNFSIVSRQKSNSILVAVHCK